MEIYYAGIGSRKTPKDVCRKMFTAGRTMARLGFILRSGGANGADSAFENGALEYCQTIREKFPNGTNIPTEIFLPFKRFNGHSSPLYNLTTEARAIAREYHPRWNVLSCLGRDFHTRNVYQVLGYDLKTPSSFVLCWTPGGKVTGGTGQALRIAKGYGIPILNFATDSDEYISDFIISTAERTTA